MELLYDGCNMSILSMICDNRSKGILNTWSKAGSKSGDGTGGRGGVGGGCDEERS